MTAQERNCPVQFCERGKACGIPAEGIVQNKGVNSSGSIGHGNWFRFARGQVYITAARTDHASGTSRILPEAQAGVQQITVEKNLWLSRKWNSLTVYAYHAPFCFSLACKAACGKRQNGLFGTKDVKWENFAASGEK